MSSCAAKGTSRSGSWCAPSKRGRPLDGIDGLWFRDGATFRRNPPRAISAIERARYGLRNVRRASCPATPCSGRPIDVVETSRGCTFDCSFCSIIEMRGRNFHRFPIERVIDDIADAHARGARSIFLVDDNITLDVDRVRGAVPRDHRRRTERHRLLRAGDDRLDRHARRDARAADAQAGFRYVFLGIENILDEDLAFLKARAKNSRHRAGQPDQYGAGAIDLLHRHGMLVVGGLIVGNPDDRRESIDANLASPDATSTGRTSSIPRRTRARR